MSTADASLRVPALEILQSQDRPLYGFSLDAKIIPSIAAVSRIRRDSMETVLGYQRPEILSHILEIKRYLESDRPMMPSSVVIAFDQRVRFEPATPEASDGYSRPGYLVIPTTSDERQGKPGFIVDGQQRIAAVREAGVAAFPIFVTAFITEIDDERRNQFILLNSAKPLSKDLIYELLPSATTTLPTLLQRRRFPAMLLERMNTQPESPFYRMIRTPTNPDGYVKGNSLLRMLENSLSDGALYRIRERHTPDTEAPKMLDMLYAYWRAVASVFSNAWGVPPRRSRLMHGAGIIGMGFIMDAIADRQRREETLSVEDFARDLRPLREVCRWTDGYWEFGPGSQRRWDEIQNTSKDIQVLTNYLLIQYKSLVWDRAFDDRA